MKGEGFRHLHLFDMSSSLVFFPLQSGCTPTPVGVPISSTGAACTEMHLPAVIASHIAEWVRSYSSAEYLRLPAKAEALLDETGGAEDFGACLLLRFTIALLCPGCAHCVVLHPLAKQEAPRTLVRGCALPAACFC